QCVLHLPRDLNEVYHRRLQDLKLLDMAKSFNGHHGGHGGQSEVETHKHFACLYANSASRVQCVVLNPHAVFDDISHDLLLTLSSHRIALLDIPCGSGAGGIALITTVKELRTAGVIPNTPLSVDIFAADYSPSALDLYESQVSLLRPKLAESGISVSLHRYPWDATQLQQTSDLIDDYIAHQANEYLVLMANFSGEGKSQFPKFERSFEHIFVRFSNRRVKVVTILWIEPQGKSGFRHITKLTQVISKIIGYFSRVDPNMAYLECEYAWFSFIQSKQLKSGVAVHAYKRDNRP
ncbi:MAG: hypothetical protein ABI353_10585, partial [Isosphaeraceae bacterium]